MENTALIPVPKLENDFYDWHVRHEAKCAAANAKNHDLIFIGDSITHFFEGHAGFENKGDAVWRKFYGKRKALNLGFGWDRTQNALYRLRHGEFRGQTPKLAVVCIGTNNNSCTVNARDNSPEETVEGVCAVCDEILKQSPKTHVLVQALFPRDMKGSQMRGRVDAINAGLAKAIPQKANCEFINFGERLLDAAGEIPLELMPDRTHPSEAGYRIWAEAIEPIVKRWL